MCRLLLVLVVASLVAATHAGRDMKDYCRDIREEMEDIYSEDEIDFLEVQHTIGLAFKVLFGPYPELARAWRSVVNRESCSSASSEYISIMSTCKAEQSLTMATLNVALMRYTDRCLTPTFWDRKLIQLLANSNTTNFERVLSDQFLAAYRKENPRERRLHFGLFTGSNKNCCQPERSRGALSTALHLLLSELPASELGPKEARRAALETYLFEPCQRYVETFDALMQQAERASVYHKDGKQAFIDGLSPTFRDAIFRFKYCSSLGHLSRHKREQLVFSKLGEYLNRS